MPWPKSSIMRNRLRRAQRRREAATPTCASERAARSSSTKNDTNDSVAATI